MSNVFSINYTRARSRKTNDKQRVVSEKCLQGTAKPRGSEPKPCTLHCPLLATWPPVSLEE